MKLYKLIIVDDEGFTLRTLAKTIPWQECGFELMGHFVRPEEAIKWAEKNMVDAIITDINMPIMDGNTMVEKIKKIQPNIVYAVLSGYDEFAYAQKALQLGAIDYLVKPVGFDEIESLCRKIYERLSQYEANIRERVLLKLKEIVKYTVVGIKPEVLRDLNFFSENPVAIVRCENESLKEYIEKSHYTKDDMYRAIENIVYFKKNDSSNIWIRLDINARNLDFIVIKLFNNGNFKYSLLKQIDEVKNEIEQFICISPQFNIIDNYEDIQKLIEEWSRDNDNNDNVQQICEVINEESFEKTRQTLQNIYKSYEAGNVMEFKKFAMAVFENFGETTEVSNMSVKEVFEALTEFIERTIKVRSKVERNEVVLQRFKKYIDEHYMEDLSLDAVAEYMHMSPSYFSKYIKKLCGERYIDYLISVRLERAAKMLLEEQCTIGELYERVGFRSPQNFYRMFNRYYGCTPKEYREKCLYAEEQRK